MNKEIYPKKDDELTDEISGYNGRLYSLYELSLSANNYTINAPENVRNQIVDKYSKVYNCLEEKIPDYILKTVYGLDENFKEIWKVVPKWFYKLKDTSDNKYEVSNLGRIRFYNKNNEKKFLLQKAKEYGYLKISEDNNYPEITNHSINIYEFISSAFLGEPIGKHIHHINNNGYDCRPDNLILLTPTQHSIVHHFKVSQLKEDPNYKN